MQIDFVGSLEGLYRPAMEALAAQGHVTHVFETPEAFHAGANLATLDVLVGVGPLGIGASVMDRAPRLRALISPVTGTEGFDEAAASERLILIANGQIAENYLSMAEATVALILAALYDLNGAQRQLAENAPRPRVPRARMVMGKTIGLIGFGMIAQGVAERLAPWQCRLLTTVRRARPLPPYIAAAPLDTLLAESDVVVVLAALNAETRGLLSLEKLRLTRPEVVIVNVARGGIVDEGALVTLARERPGLRVALDVFETEPLPPDSPLRALPHAILTPHAVGHTRETVQRLPVVLLENIERAIAGEAPDYVRNTAIIEAWRQRWKA
jgi:D-3-phosphoglycerate dehydrogenase